MFIFFLLNMLLDLFCLLAYLNSTASVGILSRLHNPQKFLLLFPCLIRLLVLFYYFVIFFYILYVESKRNVVEYVIIVFITITLHVVIQIFLISQQFMMLYMVVGHLNLLSFLWFKFLQKSFKLFTEVFFFTLIFDKYFVFLTENTLEVLIEICFFMVSLFNFYLLFPILRIQRMHFKVFFTDLWQMINNLFPGFLSPNQISF